jgi:hypothetical protein
MSKTKIPKLKQRFLAKGYSPTNWCKAFSFDTRMLYELFEGKITRTTLDPTGAITKRQALIIKLKEQGVWTGPLPWEKDFDIKIHL